MSKYIITLVHGTWARGFFCPSGVAKWTRYKGNEGDEEDFTIISIFSKLLCALFRLLCTPFCCIKKFFFWLFKKKKHEMKDSELCESLRNNLEEDVVFRRFNWSGRNRHEARDKAAEKLHGFLEKGLKEYPKDTHKHFIVAHSHGGNVALMALNQGDSSLQKKIAGIACMATPFITARMRKFGVDIITLVVSGFTSVGVSLPILSSIFHFSLNIFVFVVLFSLLTALLVILFVISYKTAEKLQQELKLNLDKKWREKLLILRSPADEASGFLTIFQFLSRVTVILYRLLLNWVISLKPLWDRWTTRVKSPICKVLKYAIIITIISSIYYIIYKWFGPPKDIELRDLLVMICAPILVSIMLLAIVYGPLLLIIFLSFLIVSVSYWPIALILFILMVIPFGWRMASANILLDATVENTPPGAWEVYLTEPPHIEEQQKSEEPQKDKKSSDSKKTTLRHSIYEVPEALEKLCEWINGRGSK